MPSNYTIEGLRSLLQEASKENEELDVIIEDLTNEVDYLKQRLSNQNYSSDGGNNVEARLLEEMMRAPAGTDEHTNRQLENAQRKVIELRDKLKIAENKLKEAGLA
jgi:predicted transcriptional regulator